MFILRGEKLRYIALLWAVLVCISRLYVGVHFPLDVMGAAVITILTSCLLLQKNVHLNQSQNLFSKCMHS